MMSKVKAYSEEHGRNISLEEAHVLYFAQELGERNRFHFLCGDPQCRAMLKPKVIGALYDRAETPGQKRRSPYFKRHPGHEHIKNCTWREQEEPTTKQEPDIGTPKPSGTVDDDMGLILKMAPRTPGNTKKVKAGVSEPDVVDGGDDARVPDGTSGPTLRARAPTSRFMGTVAAKYLRYTDLERKNKILTLEGVHSAPFYEVCIPIKGFHPYFQPQRIYFGKVKVHNLTNVFLIRFVDKMSPSGKSGPHERKFTGEIKLLKNWLAANDRDLADVLTKLSAGTHVAWCFFYTKSPPQVDRVYAKFTIDLHQLFAIVDENELEILSPATN